RRHRGSADLDRRLSLSPPYGTGAILSVQNADQDRHSLCVAAWSGVTTLGRTRETLQDFDRSVTPPIAAAPPPAPPSETPPAPGPTAPAAGPQTSARGCARCPPARPGSRSR